MAFQVLIPAGVKWIATSVLGGIFGSRGGRSGVLSDFFRGLPQRGVLGTVPGTPGINPGAPPPRVPGFPGGVSIPDRIPPRVATGAGAIARSILRGGWVGALFYPSSTSSSDTVCIATQYGPWCPPGTVANVPAAVPLPRPGGRRRPRAVPGAPPRRRERPRTSSTSSPASSPALPAPRGRPITISRPRVVAQPRVVTASMPQPRSLPPPTTTFPLPGNVALPRTSSTSSPATIARVAAAAAAVVLPALGSWVRPSIGAQTLTGTPTNLGSIPSTFPTVAPFPGVGTAPNAFPSPVAELARAPLTSFNRAVAQSPAQELDRQCRERAKRKKKKRKPRSECWKGSYTETKKGTLKRRREKIECQ